MREDMAMLNIREELVALLPRLRRFALVLCESVKARDAVLRRACAGMLDAPHGFQQCMNFDRLAFAEVYRVWASRLRQSDDTSSIYGNTSKVALSGFGSESVPEDPARLIETFAPPIRAALLLIHGERFTHAEAAQVLGVTEDMLIARVTRARIGLTDCLPGALRRFSGPCFDAPQLEPAPEENDRTQ